MVNSGMMICSFYLKTRFARSQDIYPLNSGYNTHNGEHSYNNVIDMLISFCANYFSFTDDEIKMKMFSIDEHSIRASESESYRTLSFTIQSGAYGIESNITDRTTKQIKYRRTTDDADIKDFKCLIFIPKDVAGTQVTKGIIIFQTISTYGVKTITINNMKAFFAEIGLTLETRSVSVRAFIEKLVEQGNLHKVTLIKNRVSPDSSDNIFITTGREERSFIKPHLKPEWFEKFLRLLETKSATNIFEIDDKQYNDIKVTFKLGNNYRTVALRYIDKFSVVEDFPDSIYNNGRYDESTLINYMIETANDYKDKMVFTVKGED